MRGEEAVFILHRMIADSVHIAKIVMIHGQPGRVVRIAKETYLRLAEKDTVMAPIKLETNKKMTNVKTSENITKNV